MKPATCLKEIAALAEEILREEGQHHYELFVDERELNCIHGVLDEMRNDIYDERKRRANG